MRTELTQTIINLAVGVRYEQHRREKRGIVTHRRNESDKTNLHDSQGARPQHVKVSVYLTFVSLLYLEELGSRSVLGAFVMLLVGVEYDRQGFVAVSYLILGRGIGQVEHGTVFNVSYELDGNGQ